MKVVTFLHQTPSFWVASVGRNYKKYNPWIGSQLIGVRDQFLLFHPLVLLWDLKRIQQFLHKIQGYTKYSFIIVESRPHLRTAINSYLQTKGISKHVCHLLNFEFPGTLTNQYYLNTQSTTSTILASKQIFVFFDYFLNKQFYLESLIVPSVRFSLYSLHNLPINLQYGLPARSGILLAIKLLLKLLLRPLIELQPPQTKTSSLTKSTSFMLMLPCSRPLNQKESNLTALSYSKLLHKKSGIPIFTWSKRGSLLRLRKHWLRHKQKYNQARKRRVMNILAIWKQVQKKRVRKKARTKGIEQSLTQFLSKKYIIKVLFKFATLTDKRRIKIKKNLLLKYTIKKQVDLRKTRLLFSHKFKRYSKPKRVAPKLTSNVLCHYYQVNSFITNKKKKLLDKFTRTCNIKTQKEWQNFINKFKLRNAKIKQQQKERAKRRARSKSPKPWHTRNNNPFYLNQPRSQYNQPRSQYNQPRSQYNQPRSQYSPSEKYSYRFPYQYESKQSKRAFSTKFLNIKPQFKNSHSAVPRAVVFRFDKTRPHSLWSFLEKCFRPSRRVYRRWRRFLALSRGWTLTKKKLTLPLWKKDASYNLYPSSPLYRKSYLTSYSYYNLANYLQIRHFKQKAKNRVRLVKRMRRVFRRVAFKQDRRWYIRRKKKRTLRLFHHSSQRVYTKTNIAQGLLYWRRLRMPRAEKHINKKKWSRRYFRYFVWKKNFWYYLWRKKKTMVGRHPRITNQTYLHSNSKNVSQRLIITPQKCYQPQYNRKKNIRYSPIEVRLFWRPRIKKRHFRVRKKLKKHMRLILLRFLHTSKTRASKKRKLLPLSGYLKLEQRPFTKSGIKTKTKSLVKNKTKSSLHSKKIKKYYKWKLLRQVKKHKIMLVIPWNKHSWRKTMKTKTKRVFRRFHYRLIFIKRPNLPLSITWKHKNRTTSHWFRVYRNSRILQADSLKKLSKKIRQALEQKRHFINKKRIPSYYETPVKLRKILRIKKHKFWNWRKFKLRLRSREELQRYLKAFQNTRIKLHKHKNLCLLLSKQLRQQRANQFFHNYRKSNWLFIQPSRAIKLFQSKPVKISKFDFFNFNGRLYKNRTILIGLKQTNSSTSSNFIQCYTKRRFWADDFYGPSPLRFWISRKVRRLKTPKQHRFDSSPVNLRLTIALPNFSCLSFMSLRRNNIIPPSTMESLQSNCAATKTDLLYELTNRSAHKQTFKFFSTSPNQTMEKKIRWFWYYIKNKHKTLASRWQECLTSPKSLKTYLRKRKSKKLLFFFGKRPRVLKNKIKYVLRCERRRRRRLRERTFKGPQRFRRKYRIYYQFTSLVKFNSHRNKYGKPNLKNHINHYFLRKNILRRFLRIIYGPKLTNHYFKHFSQLLFVKKFKFWTLYTFFYLRLDFISIFLKFSLNLIGARYLITKGLILVNNRLEKPSYSIFIGDVIQWKLVPNDKFKFAHELWNLFRIDPAYAPRIAKDHLYKLSLRVPAFFEYNARIQAGTMFRLPWYYEVRSKLINKENFLLLARGYQSI